MSSLLLSNVLFSDWFFHRGSAVNVPGNRSLLYEDPCQRFSENVVIWITIFATQPQNRRARFSSHMQENDLIHL